MKILVIDDSEMQQKIAKIYLEKGAGHMVHCVSTGTEGFEFALSETPDIIILDTEMPEMDGFETLRKLKNNAKTSRIPVVMCTSLDNKEVREKVLAIGAADFIKKPHGFSSLTRRLGELVLGSHN